MTFRRSSSLIGLLLNPYEVSLCHLVRHGKQTEVSAQSTAPIPAHLFKAEPERAGAELAAHLAATHLRPGRCIVCLPLNWAFLSELEAPELSDEDLDNLARTEAEKRFPLALDDLTLAVTRRNEGGQNVRLLLAAIPSDYLAGVEKALRVARLRPISITLGVAALTEDLTDAPCALIQLAEGVADLAFAQANAFPIFRNLAWREGGTREASDTDAREALRQLRISFTQLPEGLKAKLSKVHLHGNDTWTPEAQQQLREALSTHGLAMEEERPESPPDGPPVSAALLASAMRAMQGTAPLIELLAKRKTRMRSISPHLSARGTRWVLGSLGVAVLLLIAVFGIQDRRLARLENEWGAIAPKVEQVKAVQDKVRQHRPWYNHTAPSLAIPKSLADAFPEEGSIWIKSLQVKNQAEATCSGTASSRSDWMQMLAKLGENKNLDDLKVPKTQGDATFSFTLTFRWKGGSNDGR